MIRRQARLRKEYLYRKSLEEKEKQIYDRKKQIQEALTEGKRVPTELKKDVDGLSKELHYDQGSTAPTTHIDDEYRRAGEVDPKILITTSRDPSSRLVQFAKEMKLVFPNSQRVNRGNHVIKEIADVCRANEVTDLIILHETRGQPDSMIVSHFPYGPTAFFGLHNVVLRHDIPDRGTVSEAFPHLIFDGFSSKLGERACNILKYLFPVPKEDSKRAITFANRNDYISFRHHVFYKTSHKNVELAEVGPRFEMKMYKITLGTVEIETADTEWILRAYMNTTKKREFL